MSDEGELNVMEILEAAECPSGCFMAPFRALGLLSGGKKLGLLVGVSNEVSGWLLRGSKKESICFHHRPASK